MISSALLVVSPLGVLGALAFIPLRLARQESARPPGYDRGGPRMAHDLDDWLAPFGLDDFIRREVAGVLASLPAGVRDDFVADTAFCVYDYEPGPGVVMHVPVGLPRRDAA